MIYDDELNTILDDYISESGSKPGVSEEQYQSRLRRLRYDPEQINTILLTLSVEAEKEQLARASEGNAQVFIVSGIIATLSFVIIAVLSLLSILPYGYAGHILIGGTITALLTVLKGYNVRSDRKRRKAVRHLLWKGRFTRK